MYQFQNRFRCIVYVNYQVYPTESRKLSFFANIYSGINRIQKTLKTSQSILNFAQVLGNKLAARILG